MTTAELKKKIQNMKLPLIVPARLLDGIEPNTETEIERDIRLAWEGKRRRRRKQP